MASRDKKAKKVTKRSKRDRRGQRVVFDPLDLYRCTACGRTMDYEESWRDGCADGVKNGFGAHVMKCCGADSAGHRLVQLYERVDEDDDDDDDDDDDSSDSTDDDDEDADEHDSKRRRNEKDDGDGDGGAIQGSIKGAVGVVC
jgi:hypothetical protein